MDNKIKITYDELKNPQIDEVISRQAEETAMRRGAGTTPVEMQKESLLHKSWFYLSIAGLIGALIAWLLVEPYFDDNASDVTRSAVQGFLMFMSVGGFIGLMIGCMEGILARNFLRAVKGGTIGFGIGFGGGLISTWAAGMLLYITIIIGVAIVGEKAATDPVHNFAGLLLIIIARSLAWTVAGMTVGLGPGIALKSKKLTYNGFLGGMIGGIIGGLLFDPINYLVSGGTLETGAEVSRAIGFGVIGACAGLMIGLVEMLTKDAWLLMTAGPLKGKQFIIYKNPTIIGSSPKCDIYLFKDSLIEPSHSLVHVLRDCYEIEDQNTASGTFINGKKIKRQRLVSGDIIQIGETKFIYTEKAKKS